MCNESPCIHQVTLALSLLCLFSPFPSPVAVLSPGVVQNNTHTETTEPIKCISRIPDYNSLRPSMRSALGVRRWLNCPVPTPPPPLVFICHPSLLGYQADSPHLTSATLVHVTQHQPGPGLTGQNTTHQLLVSPSFSFTHTHTHEDINTGLKREASHLTCLISEKMFSIQSFCPIFLTSGNRKRIPTN